MISYNILSVHFKSNIWNLQFWIKVYHKKVVDPIIIIEHNLSISSHADWIIDLGPKGGKFGGKLICQGCLLDFIKCEISYTAKHLRRFLKLD